MIKSNLHTHTVWSDGENTVRENIDEALKKGLFSIGFSDHSYTSFDTSYCLQKENERKYISEISLLKEEYKDRIEVLCGLELDGYGECINRRDYDYVIGSCHYIKINGRYYGVDEEEDHLRLLNDFYGSDPNLFARAYFDTVNECVANKKPDIIGHFDLISIFGFMNENDEKYLKLAQDSLAACLEKVSIVEINNGAVSKGKRSVPYPALYLLPVIKEHGGKVIISSDSHRKENLVYAFDDTVDLLKSYGFDSIVIFKNGDFCEVSI